MTRTVEVEQLLDQLAGLDRMVLVELAHRGRDLPPPPTFRGRCLDADHLAAVACGAWTLDDEALLAATEDRLEAVALSRVRLRDRRGLRAVLRGAVLGVLTRDLPVPGWPARRDALSQVWESTTGALPGSPAAAQAPVAPEDLAELPA